MSGVTDLIARAREIAPFSEDEQLLFDLARELEKAQPRIITTYEELDSLPIGELVVTEQGGLWEVRSNTAGYNWWQEPGSNEHSLSEELTLPATILNVPEETK